MKLLEKDKVKRNASVTCWEKGARSDNDGKRKAQDKMAKHWSFIRPVG
jgi:hypothetical protein